MIYFHFLSLGCKRSVTISVHLNLQFSQRASLSIQLNSVKIVIWPRITAQTEDAGSFVVVRTCGAPGNKVTP